MTRTFDDLAEGNPTTLALSEVTRGERVIWADRAIRRKPGLGAWPVVVVGLFLVGFGALWSLMAWAATGNETGPWRFFPLFGFIFVGIGLLIASAPAWLRFVGGPTVYALTDRRILMISGRRSRNVRSVDIERLGDLHVMAQEDGSGDIMFGGILAEPSETRIALLTGIYGVPNIRRLRDLIEREKRRLAAERQPGAGG